jgi:tetratricopeptide (TPR) repeat protein
VLEQTEASFAYAWSRGWLDLQRYATRAAESLGYEAVAGAIRSELRSLLLDYPGLLTISLTDDTPTANEETKEWIRSTILPRPPSDESGVLVSALPSAQLAPALEIDKGTAVYDLAQVKAKQGRIQEAIEILTKEIAQESSGRSRFTRKFQLASICLASKYEVIAQPILMELAEEIEHRKLEEWEDAATIARPLALLFRCLSKLGGNEVEKQRIYQKLCRLDPLLALSVGK